MSTTWKFFFCFCITISISFLLCCSPASTLSFFKLFSTFLVYSISSLSFLLFKASAYFLIFVLTSCRCLTHLIHCGMCYVADFLRTLANSLLGMALEIGASGVSKVSELLKEIGPKVASMAYTAFNAAMELAKAGIGCLQEVVPKITRELVDVVGKVLEGVWSNYLEALKYVAEKGKLKLLQC